MGMWCTRRSSNTVVRRTKRTSSVMWACCNLVCKALTVAALTCILRLTGVSSCAGMTEMAMERYTRLLMDTSSTFLIHFLKIYRASDVSSPGSAAPACSDQSMLSSAETVMQSTNNEYNVYPGSFALQ